MSGPLLTEVDLSWWKGRVEEWLRFGAPVEEVIHDRRRRTLIFASDAVFARVRWVGGDYGTSASWLEILRAPRPGEGYATSPGVRPGATPLAVVEGWTRVRRALEVIDAIAATGVRLTDVAPDHWRHVHNRLVAGFWPRPYDRARHRAWRLRAKVTG